MVEMKGVFVTLFVTLFALAAAVAIFLWTRQARRGSHWAGTAGKKQCDRCNTANPEFAQFCQSCGRTFEAKSLLGIVSIVGTCLYLPLAVLSGDDPQLYSFMLFIPVVMAVLTRFDTRALDGRLALASLVIFLSGFTYQCAAWTVSAQAQMTASDDDDKLRAA